MYVNYTLYNSIKLYTSIKSLKYQELAIFCYKLFKYSYVNYYAYKVIYSIIGYKYSCIRSKGVLVSHKRYYIVYGYN